MKFSLRSMVTVVMLFSAMTVFAQSEERVLTDMDPFEAAKLSIYWDTLVPGTLELRETKLVIAPRMNELWIEHSTLISQFRLCFNQEVRNAIRAAAKRYFEEYEAHTLNAKKNMNHAYGKTNVRYEWGTMAFNALAHPGLSLGYRFVKDSPYFTMLIPVSANEQYNLEGSTIKQTGEVRLYFTRAQLELLSTALDNAAIEAAIADMVNENSEAQPDTY